MFSLDGPDRGRGTSPPLQVTRKPGRPNLPQTRHSARQIIISRVVSQTLASCSTACCPAASRSTARIDTSIRSIRKVAPDHLSTRPCAGSTHEADIREVTQASVIAINCIFGAALRRPPAARRTPNRRSSGVQKAETDKRVVGRGQCARPGRGSKPARRVHSVDSASVCSYRAGW